VIGLVLYAALQTFWIMCLTRRIYNLEIDLDLTRYQCGLNRIGQSPGPGPARSEDVAGIPYHQSLPN
jgi:hypothetical protein